MVDRCVLCEIAQGILPASIVYEDELTMAFISLDVRCPRLEVRREPPHPSPLPQGEREKGTSPQPLS